MPLKITKEEFQRHVPVTAAFNVAAMGADMLQVEDEYLHTAFGEDFYTDLISKYEAGEATALQLKLMDAIIGAVSNLAQASFLPVQPLQFSDRGVHIVSSTDEKTPFEHQIKSAQHSFLHKGFLAIERALRLLEKHIDAEDFVLWATSEACTIYRQYLLGSAEEFSEHYSIGNSRRTYLALLPIIKKTEPFYLASVIGDDLLYELKEQLRDRDLSVENRKLLDLYLRPALAHQVALAALDEGLFVFKDNVLASMLPGDAALDSVTLNRKRSAAYGDAQKFLAKAKAFLNQEASPEKYASYYYSNLYTAQKAPSLNNSDSSIYIF